MEKVTLQDGQEIDVECDRITVDDFRLLASESLNNVLCDEILAKAAHSEVQAIKKLSPNDWLKVARAILKDLRRNPN